MGGWVEVQVVTGQQLTMDEQSQPAGQCMLVLQGQCVFMLQAAAWPGTRRWPLTRSAPCIAAHASSAWPAAADGK